MGVMQSSWSYSSFQKKISATPEVDRTFCSTNPLRSCGDSLGCNFPSHFPKPWVAQLSAFTMVVSPVASFQRVFVPHQRQISQSAFLLERFLKTGGEAFQHFSRNLGGATFRLDADASYARTISTQGKCSKLNGWKKPCIQEAKETLMSRPERLLFYKYEHGTQSWMQAKPPKTKEEKTTDSNKDALFTPPSEFNADVHVQCIDKLQLKCHSQFLTVRSKVFRAALESNQPPPHNLAVEFPAKDFSIFLRAVYNVTIPIPANFSKSELLTLYEISHQYDCSTIEEACVAELTSQAEKGYQSSLENLEVLRIADKFNNTSLRKACLGSVALASDDIKHLKAVLGADSNFPLLSDIFATSVKKLEERVKSLKKLEERVKPLKRIEYYVRERINQPVHAKFRNGKVYPGKITAVNEDLTCSIMFNDGDVDNRVMWTVKPWRSCAHGPRLHAVQLQIDGRQAWFESRKVKSVEQVVIDITMENAYKLGVKTTACMVRPYVIPYSDSDRVMIASAINMPVPSTSCHCISAAVGT
eukprot:g25820.t1